MQSVRIAAKTARSIDDDHVASDSYQSLNLALVYLKNLRHGFGPRTFDASRPGCYDRHAGWSSLVARWAQ
jgi:hypothetical protein